MYESRRTPLLSRAQFLERVARHVLAAVALLALSLGIGMAGFMRFQPNTSAVDAFLNSSMLLGGMGPVGTLSEEHAKLFAGFYALYAGLVFIVAAGLIVAPIAHRLLHRFHWEEDADASS
ncbi:hypothetical protein DWG18_09415 [Lysobacter sp. TY2-98]|uniref:hypothetical protein n=1 Tax=Lysobacter sp. TY2-98 TaxID=2290922 RepID=UPI000E20637E|nr:hypothetical protein [Lysobacter sp. TY2-98]AXK72467.1 hypothetical protein DWG18_09415 [Lysobacter sp. TY2-98]